MRFLCQCCVDNAPSTHTKDTQRTATHHCFLLPMHRRVPHNSLTTIFFFPVNICCCCLSWSLTGTLSQSTPQMHTHRYKSHIHGLSYLHYGYSFYTIDMNNNSSNKHDSGFIHECLSVHEFDSLKLYFFTNRTLA